MYLNFNKKEYNQKPPSERTKEEIETFNRVKGFIRYKFDKLELKSSNDNDYGLFFNFLRVGENVLYKSPSLKDKPVKLYMIELLKNNQMGSLPSLVYGCKDTNHCGTCKSSEDKNDENNIDTNGSNWICCDGPRNDKTGIILCNQWYHKSCINNYIRNGSALIIKMNEKHTALFGNKCKHAMWYDVLNDDVKSYVISNLNFIHSKLDNS